MIIPKPASISDLCLYLMLNAAIISAENIDRVEELVLIWLIIPTDVSNVWAISTSNNPVAMDGGDVAYRANASAAVRMLLLTILSPIIINIRLGICLDKTWD